MRGQDNCETVRSPTYKFAGMEFDSETGNYYDYARYYSPRLGRFMSPDPADLAAVDPTNPQSWNRYAYVLNNPTSFTDPTGLDGCQDVTSVLVNTGEVIDDTYQGDCGSGTGTVSSGGDTFDQLLFLLENGGSWGDSFGQVVGDGIAPNVPPTTSTQTTQQLPQTPTPQQSPTPCVQTVFDPSCKPKEPPSCPSVFVNGTLNALSNGGPVFPPGENPDDLIRAGGSAWAATYVMEKGLAVPQRSSVVRNFLGDPEFFAEMTVFVPIIYSEAQGLKREVSEWSSGTCSTAWTKP
jgi:RHS repeat-associated protein